MTEKIQTWGKRSNGFALGPVEAIGRGWAASGGSWPGDAASSPLGGDGATAGASACSGIPCYITHYQIVSAVKIVEINNCNIIRIGWN